MRLILVLAAAALLSVPAFAQKDAVAVTAGVWAKASGEKPKAQVKAESDGGRGYAACVRAVEDGKAAFLCIGQYVQDGEDYFTPTLKKDGVDEWYDYGRYKCWKDGSGKCVMQQVDKAGNPLVVLQAAAPPVQQAQPSVASYPSGFTTTPAFGGWQFGAVQTTGGCAGGTCPTAVRYR